MFVIRTRNGYGTAACFALFLFLTLAATASISIPELPKEKRSEKKKQIVPPPQPIAVSVEVPSSGTVQIPLRIYGKQEQTTSFLIRKGPQLGKIVALAPMEPEVWLLTYQHTSAMTGEARLKDRILFAAQNKNGTSAAAEIVIDIVDAPPELAAPESVDFGKVPAGLPATRGVTVSNNGGGLLEGKALADAPWTVEPAYFKLRQGEKALFHVTLAPDAEGEYQSHLHFLVGDTQAQPALHASAYAPFTVEPSKQDLTSGLSRSGSLALTNQTATELTLQLEANARLHLPAQIVLPPRKTEIVPITLEKEDPEGIDTTVRLSFGSIFKQVAVHAQPVRKELPSPTPAPVAIAQPSPTPTPELRNLPPPPPTGDVPGHPASPEPDAQSIDSAILNALGQPQIPVIGNVSVVRTTVAGIAELAWPAVRDSSDYQIEARQISIGAKGNPVQNWIAVPNVKITKAQDRVTAVITGIPTGVSATIHILALGPEGKPCAASLPVHFNIPTPQPLFTARNLLLAGFGLLLLVSLAMMGLKKLRSGN